MAAPKGNDFWKARYNHGRQPKIATASQLWNAAVKYFEWLQKNPLLSVDVVKHLGEGKNHEVPRMRAPTLHGLWVFIGIGKSTWYEYKDRPKGFAEVTERIENVLYDWKFQGAAAGLLNANIIARDLKLKDHADITSDDEPIREVRVFFDEPRADLQNAAD